MPWAVDVHERLLTDLLVSGKEPRYFGFSPSAEGAVYLIAASSQYQIQR